MYQVADYGSVDSTRLFIETCTSLPPSADTVRLVRSAARLFKGALDGHGLEPLRAFVSGADHTAVDVDDVIAAAGQSVIDELNPAARGDLANLVHRVAQIERDALSSLQRRFDSPVRAVVAG